MQMYMQLPMPRLMHATTQTWDLSGFTPLFHPRASPCAARESILPTTLWFSFQQPHQQPPHTHTLLLSSQWRPWHLPVHHARPHCFIFRNPVSYFSSVFQQGLSGRDVGGVKLKKDLVCTIGSWVPLSGYSLSGKDKPTTKWCLEVKGRASARWCWHLAYINWKGHSKCRIWKHPKYILSHVTSTLDYWQIGQFNSSIE